MFKKYIFRNVAQDFLLIKNLSLEEGLILDYLIGFYEADINIKKNADGKLYYWCNTAKMRKDLPILKVDDRQLRRYLHHLKSLNIIEFRLFNRRRFFHISMDAIFEARSDKMFYYDQLSEEECYSLVDKIKIAFKKGW